MKFTKITSGLFGSVAMILVIVIGALFCIALLYLMTPSEDDGRFENNIIEYASEKWVSLPLGNLTWFEWDFVCLALTYENPSDLDRQLKLIGHPPLEHGIWEGSENYYHLVFVHRSQANKLIRIDASRIYINKMPGINQDKRCLGNIGSMIEIIKSNKASSVFPGIEIALHASPHLSNRSND